MHPSNGTWHPNPVNSEPEGFECVLDDHWGNSNVLIKTEYL